MEASSDGVIASLAAKHLTGAVYAASLRVVGIPFFCGVAAVFCTRPFASGR
jgi:hypothetical protein